MTTNINTTTSTPNWEIKLQTSLQKAGFEEEKQGKIIANIANELQKKSTTEPTERDIFEAANKVYKFNNQTNLGLAKAIDGLDGKINIHLSESKAQWTDAGAVDEREQPDDSRNIIGSSIGRIKDKNRTTEITVNDIITDLKEKNVIMVNPGEVMKNKHLHDNLVAMKDQGVTAEQIIRAAKTDTDWNKLIGTVKKNQNITVDSIIRYT
ncbi:MAG: hypothetical protein KGO93_07380 [Cyanobacteria bacterium REEB446]|nr:hypothetical protein [Cyanobacteria bacterium REEB446]